MRDFLKKHKNKLIFSGVIGSFVIGYVAGFNRCYCVQVSPTYRDPSLLRYITGRSLDISANGVRGGLDLVLDALKGAKEWGN